MSRPRSINTLQLAKCSTAVPVRLSKRKRQQRYEVHFELKATEDNMKSPAAFEVTTTTTSLAGSIPSPSPFTFARSMNTGACHTTTKNSTQNVFDYNSSYPLTHCVKPSTGLVTFDDLNLLCLSVYGIDAGNIDDDTISTLIVEMGLDRMEKLPELRVGHHDLSDQNVLIVGNEA